MTELKPCPFCGSTNIYVDEYDHHCGNKRWRVVCLECMGQVDAGIWQSKLPAIEAWNTRYERTCKFIEVGDDYDEIYAQVYKCSNCGMANIGTAFFCPNCGAKVVSE